jgi:cholestenol delta-isomerase
MHGSRGLTAGTIHVFFEGYFAYNHTRMAPATDVLGQMWKEYAYSDSRYLTSDPFVLCTETITAVRSRCRPQSPLQLIRWRHC